MELPTPASFNSGVIGTVLGIFLMIIGFGYKDVANDPNASEAIKKYSSTLDFTALAGFMVSLGGTMLTHGNNKKAQAAHAAASIAAPVNADGEQDWKHTMNVGIQQLLAADGPTSSDAIRIIRAIRGEDDLPEAPPNE